MTLVSRNRLFLASFILAVVFIVVTTVFFIIAMLNDSIAIPQEHQRLFHLPQFPLLSSNFLAALASAVLLTLYSAVILGISLVNFEKTRSLEIIYLVFFGLGCLFEGIRIWLPVVDLWADNSRLYVLMGQLLFFGRVLSVISLLALSLLAIEMENKQNIELSILVVGSVAALLARAIPINTLVIPSNCGIRFGMETTFLLISAVSLLAGFMAMLHQSHDHGSPEYAKVSIGFIILSAGYLVLTETDCLLFLGVGGIMITVGSILFLMNLHKFHMWK